jgi:outer membrane immunogenic protein
MAKNFLCIFAIACLGSAAVVTGASAQTSDDSIKRLEAKLDALAKENSSLRSRLTKVEAAPRAAKPKQEPGYVGPIGKPSADPTPQQINAARESFAADMPVAVKYAPPPRPACAQFGGWYVGAQGGWAYRDHKWSDRDGLGRGIDTSLDGSISSTNDGFVGGATAGWNWQSGCTVFGVEADWSWSSLKISEYNTDNGLGLALDTATIENKMRWFGTARTRAGVVVDNLMIYVTGGLAFANFQNTWTFLNPSAGAAATFTSSDTQWGWTAGVGTEWAFAPNWTLKSEFLYMRFEKDSVTALGVTGIGNPGQAYRFDSENSVWVTRLGVNYRFGDYGKTPVMAKY